MKKLHLLILFSLFTVIVSAQNNYMLYSFKGNVSVVENKVETKAKVGKTVSANAVVKVPSGAAVTIICNEAAMFTFSKAGSYALNKFGDSCTVGNNSVSANYVKYVWAQMTKSSGSPGSNRKAYMNTVGAVSRGLPNVWVDARLDTINYSDGAFPISWKSYEEAKEFDFKLYNYDNVSTPIYSTVIKDKKKIDIKSFTDKMKPGNSYFWTASIKGEDSEEYKTLHYVTKEDFKIIENKLKSQGAAFEAKAEQAYRMGFMLEDAHFLSEAFQYYNKAATLDSTNALYRSTLMSFRKDYEMK
ncbi:MAG: hypothetical protein IPH34_01515 [Chitinophagaceae bacterium]|nr:hypothetical protein [Chitinophagaceae bacterium]